MSIKEHIGHDVEVVTYGNGINGNARSNRDISYRRNRLI